MVNYGGRYMGFGEHVFMAIIIFCGVGYFTIRWRADKSPEERSEEDRGLDLPIFVIGGSLAVIIWVLFAILHTLQG